MAKVAEVLGAFEQLPLCDLDTLTGGETVLVLAPHADDESLGCGGLIAEACARGRPPIVVILTDGVGSHPNSKAYPASRLLELREQEARAATGCLGLPVDRLYFMRLSDTKAPTEGADFNLAVGELRRLVDEHGCGIIAAPWRHDPHCDHEAAHAMAVAVAQRAGVRLLSYPVWGWTLPPEAEIAEHVAGCRLDIAPHVATKQRAIAAHASQYSDLITDDATGFRLPPGLLAVFERPYEVFLRAP